MKLSTLTIGALIIFSTNALAQTAKSKGDDKPKTKTTAAKKDKTIKVKRDSVKVSDNKNRPITHNYCPPCGMG